MKFKLGWVCLLLALPVTAQSYPDWLQKEINSGHITRAEAVQLYGNPAPKPAAPAPQIVSPPKTAVPLADYTAQEQQIMVQGCVTSAQALAKTMQPSYLTQICSCTIQAMTQRVPYAKFVQMMDYASKGGTVRDPALVGQSLPEGYKKIVADSMKTCIQQIVPS
jgi:hypothetical protein